MPILHSQNLYEAIFYEDDANDDDTLSKESSY